MANIIKDQSTGDKGGKYCKGCKCKKENKKFYKSKLFVPAFDMQHQISA